METKSKIMDARLQEMSEREKVVEGLRELNLGSRATRLFCESELSYAPFEARAILVKLGLVLTSDAMTSEDPRVKVRIDRLRDWRRARARRDGVPVYRVLTNRTLMTLASECPSTPALLRDLKGIGPKSADLYGAELLALLEA